MTDTEIELPHNETIKKQIIAEFESIKQLVSDFNINEIKSGDYFLHLLRIVTKSYESNARAEYFQQKYPGLPRDEIADRLISVAARYATVAGGIAGLAA